MHKEDMKTLHPEKPAHTKLRPTTERDGRNLFKPGDMIGTEWEVINFIARGGISEVYLAQNLGNSNRAAVKVISHKALRSISANNVEFENCVERFRREFKTVAEICHPNVVVVYDYGSMPINKNGESDLIEYIAMEYLKGATLRSTILEWGFYPSEERIREWLTRYYLPLLDGVIALHEMRIIHRDLKPDNVLLDGEVPKIADFWLARSQRLGRVTKTFELKGSPSYMSPEHFCDLKRTDERTDVYSLGIILAEAIGGKRVHEGLPFKTIQLFAPEIPEFPFFRKLDLIIQDATQEYKEMRFSSVKDLKENIENMLLNSDSETVPAGNIQPKSVQNSTLIFIALILSVIIFMIGLFIWI